jgi:N-acetylmuramoyl-L-alanine amidase
VLAAAIVWLPAAHGAEVQGMRVSSDGQGTRLVLDLSAPVDHRLFTLDDPNRIVVDLVGSTLDDGVETPGPEGYIAGVRTGQRPSGELRVVLDLKQPVTPKSFLLPPQGHYGNRLVIDLAPRGKDVIKRAPVAAPGKGRALVVAIDPGHGGHDPGASGPDGVQEKDVVLDIAKRLARDLGDIRGIQPVLTRDGDYYVRFRRRLAIAREHRADLFVSIHADAFRNASAHGATVYALSTKRASDEVARRLAQRENGADLVGGVSLADKDKLLARVLLDLSQNAAISGSMTAGNDIIHELERVTRMRKRTVQRAPFIVLTSPDIPSLLVETAYITNPHGERFLNNDDDQARLAEALADGIVDYFRQNAPPDTYLASNPPPKRRPPLRHVIKRGETLSGIAQRYRVSLSTLRRSNGLHSDTIRIGQVLSIPRG